MRSVLPRDFPVRRRGSCVPAAYLIAKSIGDCDAVCGYVGPNRDEHTWVERGGEIIDPTIRQFRWWRASADVVREPIRRWPAADFIAEMELKLSLPWWVSEAGEHYRKILGLAAPLPPATPEDK